VLTRGHDVQVVVAGSIEGARGIPVQASVRVERSVQQFNEKTRLP
jgi:hypothetical protein